MSADALLSPAVPSDQPASALFGNKFLLVTVAARRVLQIRDGARPRVDVASHKATVVAVAEVLAGCIPFSSD